ncbi:MAG: response regulator [Rhodocyclaceae bacterium]|nr:response regulator [Rhodocyclaceae bacterium]
MSQVSEMKILVVDDEPFNLDIIIETLDDPSYQLTTAESGEEAWDLLSRPDSDFDLVVLDRMMRGIDGIEVLRRIKADPRLSEVPVIMQTAAASPDQVREGLQAGAHYYLTKPFELEALETIVRAALEDAAQRRSLLDGMNHQARVIKLADSAVFRIRTLEDAQHLAALLGNLFPEPQLGAMGLSELFINAIEHGNLGIDFAEKSRLKEQDRWHDEVVHRLGLPEFRELSVTVSIARKGSDWEFLIEDQGKGFEWERFLELDPERAFAPNGRGIALARQLAFSRLTYEGSGNRVRVLADGGAA